MKIQKTLEHIKGKYQIIAAALPVIGAIIAAVYFTGDGLKNQQELNINSNQNSPIATEIHTQNNFYGTPPPTDTTTKRDSQKDTTHPISKSKNVEPAKKEPVPEKTSTSAEKEPATIDAPNALIITQNQSGGSNTVNVNKIETPPPVIKLSAVEVHNVEVKELPLERGERPRRVGPNGESEPTAISLPSEGYNYDKLYKTRFTLNYSCPVTLSQVGFSIKRDDVVRYHVTHVGFMNSSKGEFSDTKHPVFVVRSPENGNYTFEVYTVKKFGNPLEELIYLKD